ncbi:tetratricopeptide repeat protein [Neorhodopirellula pilleata]|uniref:Tetratricopeptide repeat protein n=1 Tax=Neorhodopirellula pilleata TaxID=2714738 RepID=A0A5C6AQ88_9BACT|nr:tetratricopeptide repeat protein [Neorhodopirellula pilleata]TWU01890.1 Tetratricopeptide repeat protein [Neorhodopirellula pilleata]
MNSKSRIVRCLLLTLAMTLLFRGTGQAEEAVPVSFPQETSGELTTAAWESFNAKNYDKAIAYAKECIKRHGQEAIEMQKSLTEPVPSSDQEAVHSKWALNDVGTCYFIIGQALEKQSKPADAIKAYKKLVDTVAFAQCWDPQGWFWKPADAAKKQIKSIEFALIDQAE